MKKISRHRRLVLQLSPIAIAIAASCAASGVRAQSDNAVKLKPVEIVNQAPVTLLPTESAPSQSKLEATSAMSVVSDLFVRNFVSPVADYSQIINLTPGVYSYQPNGVGLGDTKPVMRGLPESNFNILFDGIPFNDTNGVSHHSWVFFPGPFVGGAVVDRSPGSAATIGQASYGGSFDIQSRVLSDERYASGTASIGSWNTQLYNVEYNSGRIGDDGDSRLLLNAHEMSSDGYETYNYQQRQGFSLKYEHTVSADTRITAFTSLIDLKSNTPNIKGITRSDFNNGLYTNLMNNQPGTPQYYGYNTYDVPTDFSYLGIVSNIGDGWTVDDKFYRYAYHNKQFYNNGTSITATSATDKLNSYTTYGNILRFSRATDTGILRTGLWLEQASSYRFQAKSSPLTLVDATVPNFSENYTTTTVQPYVEYEYKYSDRLSITPGVKYSQYSQSFVHAADNGGAVGGLGGAPSVSNAITYTDVLPSLAANYKIRKDWSAYAQYAWGDQIPSTSVFDVTGAKVSPAPSPTVAKVTQVGTVVNSDRWTFASDVYYMLLDGTYTRSATPDANGNFSYSPSGTQVNQGIEAEANYAIGGGWSVYMNATYGSYKYANGNWVSGAPADTETVAVTYISGPWKSNLSVKRVGTMYNDGTDLANNTVNQAFTIDPVTVTNLFVNYTQRRPDASIREARYQFAVNNLFDQHSITGVASATAGSTSANPSTTDLLSVLPGRSVSVTATLSF